MKTFGPIVVQYLVSDANQSDAWSEFEWCYINVTDTSQIVVKRSPRVIDVLGNRLLPNEDQCDILTPLPERLRVFDPTVDVQQTYCLAIRNNQLYRFRFSFIQAIGVGFLPPEKYNSISDSWFVTKEANPKPKQAQRHKSPETLFDINEDDYASLNNSGIVALKQDFIVRYKNWSECKRNAERLNMSEDEREWMVEREKLDFDDLKDAVLKFDEPRKLNDLQCASVNNSGYGADWWAFKRESKSKESYCLALMAILSCRTSDDEIEGLDKQGIHIMHCYLIPSCISKFQWFYEGETRSEDDIPKIGDVHNFMTNLLFQELSNCRVGLVNQDVLAFNKNDIVRFSESLMSTKVGKFDPNRAIEGLNDVAIEIYHGRSFTLFRMGDLACNTHGMFCQCRARLASKAVISHL